MTNYSRGANFERQVKAHLEGRGYFVIRAAGSHGIVDLLAMPTKRARFPFVMFIQCKTNGKASPADRKLLNDAANSVGAWPYMACRPKKGIIRYGSYRDEKVGRKQWEWVEP